MSHSVLSIKTFNSARLRRLKLPKCLPVILNFVFNTFKSLSFVAGIFKVFKDDFVVFKLYRLSSQASRLTRTGAIAKAVRP